MKLLGVLVQFALGVALEDGAQLVAALGLDP